MCFQQVPQSKFEANWSSGGFLFMITDQTSNKKIATLYLPICIIFLNMYTFLNTLSLLERKNGSDIIALDLPGPGGA